MISQDSMIIMELVLSGRAAKEHGGAMFGPDASLWPAWYMDAVSAVSRAEMAELEAKANASK